MTVSDEIRAEPTLVHSHHQNHDGSEWAYVPIRRFSLFLEQSLLLDLAWTVFEANNQALWDLITQVVSSRMHHFFELGALAGSCPEEAFYVRCDETTVTQEDIDNGLVNIMIGFAPLNPAEFVVIQIQQSTGDQSSER